MKVPRKRQSYFLYFMYLPYSAHMRLWRMWKGHMPLLVIFCKNDKIDFSVYTRYWYFIYLKSVVYYYTVYNSGRYCQERLDTHALFSTMPPVCWSNHLVAQVNILYNNNSEALKKTLNDPHNHNKLYFLLDGLEHGVSSWKSSDIFQVILRVTGTWDHERTTVCMGGITCQR